MTLFWKFKFTEDETDVLIWALNAYLRDRLRRIERAEELGQLEEKRFYANHHARALQVLDTLVKQSKAGGVE